MSDPLPLSFLPGVCKSNSAYADSIQGAVILGRQAVGRFTDMDKTVFYAGFPEKMGGWGRATSEQMTGVPRGMKDWRDFSQNVYTAVGTHKKLYVYNGNATTKLTNITPLRGIVTGTLSNKLSTSNGSPTVNVEHTSHGQQVGDYVMLTAASAVGGLTIADVYTVASVVDANNYTITASSNATSTASSGGGTLTYEYYRTVQSNPISTVSGSATVTISHTAHGAQQGDTVIVSNASAVGGITLSGSYEVQTASTNSFTVTASSNASSTASGGGSVNLQYEINIGLEDSAFAYGYGTGGYGENGYGTTGSTGILLNARTWSLWSYGQQMLCNPAGGRIYVYDPTVGGRAYPLYGAPDEVLYMFVTAERFVTALGVDEIKTRIAWADQEDYKDWVASVTDTANESRVLQVGNYCVAGLSVRDGASLIFTDLAPYNHLYTGDDNVYNDDTAGIRSGLAGPLAGCVVGEQAYWMGVNEFWNWNGSVQALPSDDIRDYVFKDINLEQRVKFVAAPITAKKLIRFFYCSANSVEIDRYVDYYIEQACWGVGTTDDDFIRTGCHDRELYSYPMGCSDEGYIYHHEYGVDANGAAMRSFVKFSPIDIANGKVLQDIFSFTPDFKRVTGDVDLYVITQDYPNSTEVENGPYNIGQGVEIADDVREEGRLCGYKIVSDEIGGDWRLGLPKVEIQPAGARR